MDQSQRKILIGIDWEHWDLSCFNNWYDGPFLDIQIGPFWCVFNWDRLPYIFQDRSKNGSTEQ